MPLTSAVPPGAVARIKGVNIMLGIAKHKMATVIAPPGPVPPLDWGLLDTLGFVTGLFIEGDTIILGKTNNLLSVSTDGGVTFGANQTGNVGRNDIPLVAFASNGTSIICGSNYTKGSRSVDGGTTWITMSQMFAASPNSCVGIVHIEGDTFVALSHSSGASIHMNAGNGAWTYLPDGLNASGASGTSIAAMGNTVIALFKYGITSRSLNKGIDGWTALTTHGGGSAGTTGYIAAGDGIWVKAYTGQSAFYWSDDDGDTWTEVLIGADNIQALSLIHISEPTRPY